MVATASGVYIYGAYSAERVIKRDELGTNGSEGFIRSVIATTRLKVIGMLYICFPACYKDLCSSWNEPMHTLKRFYWRRLQFNVNTQFEILRWTDSNVKSYFLDEYAQHSSLFLTPGMRSSV